MDEQQIEHLLDGFRAEPGERFYRRMAAAPWQARRNPHPVWKKLRLAAAASLALIILLFASVPPLQGLARDWIRFFLFEDTVELGEGAAANRQFDLSPQEAGLAAGFDVLEPSWLPGGFVLEGADYDPRRNAVILNYLQPGGLLRITQSMGEGTREIGSIGSDALVLPAELTFLGRQLEAEYVEGAWRLPPFDQVLEEGQPGVSVTLQASWDPAAKIHMLRWESGGILYEIIHGDQDGGNLTLDVILQIAEGMQ